MKRYIDRKHAIRTELLRCAFEGKFPSYAEFGKRVGVPAQGPWKPVLDTISREETAAGYPDITFILINKTTKYPGQIGFVSSGRRPSPAQKVLARNQVQRVIDLYCPGVPNPYASS